MLRCMHMDEIKVCVGPTEPYDFAGFVTNYDDDSFL